MKKIETKLFYLGSKDYLERSGIGILNSELRMQREAALALAEKT